MPDTFQIGDAVVRISDGITGKVVGRYYAVAAVYIVAWDEPGSGTTEQAEATLRHPT
jgi:hypothetical protein